jgi:hypothetical protein
MQLLAAVWFDVDHAFNLLKKEERLMSASPFLHPNLSRPVSWFDLNLAKLPICDYGSFGAEFSFDRFIGREMRTWTSFHSSEALKWSARQRFYFNVVLSVFEMISEPIQESHGWYQNRFSIVENLPTGAMPFFAVSLLKDGSRLNQLYWVCLIQDNDRNNISEFRKAKSMEIFWDFEIQILILSPLYDWSSK